MPLTAFAVAFTTPVAFWVELPPFIVLGIALVLFVACEVGLVPAVAVAAALLPFVAFGPVWLACGFGFALLPVAFAVALPPFVAFGLAALLPCDFRFALLPGAFAVTWPPFVTLGDALLAFVACRVELALAVAFAVVLPLLVVFAATGLAPAAAEDVLSVAFGLASRPPLAFAVQLAVSTEFGGKLAPLIDCVVPTADASACAAACGGFADALVVSGAVVLASSKAANG